MNGFEKFIEPIQKENIKFVLSGEISDENNAAAMWEMRQISAQEGLEIERQYASKGDTEVMIALVAASIVMPDLRDAELLAALSKKDGKTILSPSQALKSMLTMPQLVKLIKLYISYNELDQSIQTLAAQAKN